MQIARHLLCHTQFTADEIILCSLSVDPRRTGDLATLFVSRQVKKRSFTFLETRFLALDFSNRIFTEGICKLFDLIIADLIDEDQYLHRRTFPLPALIFGLMTFLSKPGQTLAPIVSSRLLYASDPQPTSLFTHLILIPILCSFSQLLLWRNFTLHSHRLKSVRSIFHHSTQHTII